MLLRTREIATGFTQAQCHFPSEPQSTTPQCVPKTGITIVAGVERRTAELRRLARTGSAVDGFAVTIALPSTMALTEDRADIETFAAHADRVSVSCI